MIELDEENPCEKEDDLEKFYVRFYPEPINHRELGPQMCGLAIDMDGRHELYLESIANEKREIREWKLLMDLDDEYRVIIEPIADPVTYRINDIRLHFKKGEQKTSYSFRLKRHTKF